MILFIVNAIKGASTGSDLLLQGRKKTTANKKIVSNREYEMDT
jgi:hypothetical protein